MISAAGIPRIDGDMDALVAHARGLGEFGVAFADIGARFHATWQGLVAFYQAPEVGQLLAVTAPVQHVCTAAGEDYQTVGRVLERYSAEVRQFQARLDALRAQAADFERSVDGDDDWADDDAQRDRNNELLAAVNTAMADFHDAERRCANAINALYGGQQYRASDGDGRHERGEYGATAGQYGAAAAGEGGVPWGKSVSDDPGMLSGIGHGILDVGGLVPVIGEPLDGINAAWYAAEGDYTNAALSAAAMVPIAGWAATGGKFGIKGVKAVRSADGARAFVKNRPSMVPRHAERLEFTPNTKFPRGEAYRWRDPATGKEVRYHAHGPDPDVPSTQNAGQGPIYRQKLGNNHWLDAQGNRYTRNSVEKPGSKAYNPQAVNDTHIPYPKGQPPPDQPHVRVAAPNPAGLAGPDGDEK